MTFEAPGRTPIYAPGTNPFALANQTVQAVLLWSYAASFMGAAPFFLAPPLWIAALSLARR